MKFKVAAVFSNNMVLQRDKVITVFGQAKEGANVSVTITDKEGKVLSSGEAVATKPELNEYTLKYETYNNNFLVKLPAISAKNDCQMVVTCGEESKTFTNIAIGDVWLLGGQSNMEFELGGCTTGKKHLAEDKPNVRFYYTQKKAVINQDFIDSEENTGWSEWNEWSKCWSAVGYIAGKKLAEEVGVTIGLLGCNWGGTSASCWMSREKMLELPDTATYIEDYDKSNEGKSIDDQIAEFEEYAAYAAEWDKKAAKYYAEDPYISWDVLQKIIGPNKWPGPINCMSPQRPTGLYHSMIKRVAPYTLKGFMFYQGESDDHKPKVYRNLFTKMIEEWRNEFLDEELPMLFVQLPGNRYEADPDYKHWCLIREAQSDVAKTVKNAYMACIIECGEFNDIHPKDKEPVGDRLARLALAYVYGLMDKSQADAPECEGVSLEGEKAVVSWTNVNEIKALEGEIVGFEVTEDGENYFAAKAEISGNKVTVSAPEVKKVKAVRYIWTNYPEKVSLYGENGLPLAPFRSDRGYDGTNQDTQVKIQQIMEL